MVNVIRSSGTENHTRFSHSCLRGWNSISRGCAAQRLGLRWEVPAALKVVTGSPQLSPSLGAASPKCPLLEAAILLDQLIRGGKASPPCLNLGYLSRALSTPELPLGQAEASAETTLAVQLLSSTLLSSLSYR